MDGTFSAAPAPFIQCFVLGAFVNNTKIAICAHALLPGKARRYYMEALEAIKRAVHPIAPHRSKEKIA
jgi:hypothetical protein